MLVRSGGGVEKAFGWIILKTKEAYITVKYAHQLVRLLAADPCWCAVVVV
jgi:hypothetical protein